MAVETFLMDAQSVLYAPMCSCTFVILFTMNKVVINNQSYILTDYPGSTILVGLPKKHEPRGKAVFVFHHHKKPQGSLCDQSKLDNVL